MLGSGEDGKIGPCYPLQLPLRRETFNETCSGMLSSLPLQKLSSNPPNGPNTVPAPPTVFEYRPTERDRRQEARLKMLLASSPVMASQIHRSPALASNLESPKMSLEDGKMPTITHLAELNGKCAHPSYLSGQNASTRLHRTTFKKYGDAREEGRCIPLRLFSYGLTERTPELSGIFPNELDLDSNGHLNEAGKCFLTRC